MGLEQSLEQIATANGLSTVDVGRMPVGDRVVWTATLHWVGYSRSGNPCKSGHSNISIAEAVARALGNVAADRTPPVAEIEALPAIDMAEAA
ncbi:hypothetical protein [Sphingomonas japonica]|uniref:Uncharacterized protein n=2 Tax=Sphingomonas japonica TaxID=511662 RepID=A0ABX0U432_9SPHN|nr:hypothetical protein [Sphingomonas japonica]NIJ24805.1 hypothetical protein [Sphingomonas japonica]